jgi:hypothetical protein
MSLHMVKIATSSYNDVNFNCVSFKLDTIWLEKAFIL